MRATGAVERGFSRRGFAAVLAAIGLTLSVLGGTAQAGNTRNFAVTVGLPTPVSGGGVTKFDVNVVSSDNQTIANVVLTVPAPTNTAITGVFGTDAGMCPLIILPIPTLRCDFGNISAFGHRSISVLAKVDTTATGSITFSASAETNNENGTNTQVKSGSNAVSVSTFSDNALLTFDLGGSESTSPLGTGTAGTLQTTLHLLRDNDGAGNAIGITESRNLIQPAYCVTLRLTCQPDFAEVQVNGGAPVAPYLETVLIAKVPKTYNIKKAFVLHIRDDNVVEPIFNTTATSCATQPMPLPCADFSITKDYVLTITVHTSGNGKFQF
jgi:hypothetical protein